jgi:trimethylamine--corrinoid protein Co-methyltransferase
VRGATVKPSVFQVLSPEELAKIHERSLSLLARVGVRVPHPEILGILASTAGIRVEEGAQTVRFSPEIVEASIRGAAKSFSLFGRDATVRINFGCGERIYLSSPGQYAWVDEDGEQRRSPRLSDARDAIKLGDALENIRWVGAMAAAVDIPAEVRDIYLTKELLRGTRKPAWAWVGNGNTARHILKLYEIVLGGSRQLREHPPLLCFVEPISPLGYSRDGLDILLQYSRYGLPVCSGPMATAGSTAPVTLAGTLVQENAEILSTLVIAQRLSPGSPFCYGGIPHTMDPRTVEISFASPEFLLMAVCTAQLARHYGFPVYINTGMSDSKLCDAQSGLERGITMALGVMTGADTFGHLGICGFDQAASLNQLVIDDETIAYIERFLRGFTVDEDTLAAEVIERVGVGGNYLADEHTIRHLRAEIWVPRLLNKDSWERWWSSGHRSLAEVASERKRQLLSTHQQAPLEPGLAKEIDELVERATEELVTGR